MAGGGPQPRGTTVAGLLCVLALSPTDSVAQQGKPNVPPQLPPQASERAQQKVAEHTAPTVSLTAPFAGALYTAPAAVLLEASAVASSSGRSIAQVAFFAGTTLIGTTTASPFQFNWSNVTAGSYSLTARATDNLGVASTSAPVSIIVNAPPTVSLAAPANNALYTAPAAITLTADAADSDGGIAQVEFYQGTALIATVTNAPFTAGLSNVIAGSYTYSARATDDRGAAATSTPVTVRVNAPPSISLTSPVANATFTAPATVPLSAQALDSDGTVARVEFYNGSSLIGALTTPPFNVNWLLVPAGSYNLTARVTDDLGATAASEAVSVTVNQAVAQIYYIHTDHLSTPRAIYDQQQRLVWRWDNEDPFGGNPPIENPSGLGNFTCNLRFPGQYFDSETSFHYNYFRDYDPVVGRYVQSDPIGLQAGTNTYAHVLNNPLSYVDPFGLNINVCFFADAAAGFGHIGYGVGTESKTFGFYPTGNPFGSPGQVQEDVQKSKECKIITSSLDQDICMLECRARWTSNPGTYNLSSRQCTTFVRECLKECGLPTGNFSGNPPWRFYQQLPTKK